MTDLVNLLGVLVDVKGHIQVPGIYDTVAKLTEEEENLYQSIDFDMASNLKCFQ